MLSTTAALPLPASRPRRNPSFGLLVRLQCQPIIQAPRLGKSDCDPAASGRSRVFSHARPLHPVVCPPVCFEGEPRVQSSCEVSYSLPETFDGDEGHRLLVRHVSEAARKAVCASILHYTLVSRSSAHSSVPIGTPITPSPLLLRQYGRRRFQEASISSAVGACSFGGNATVLAGLLAPMPVSSSLRRRKATPLLIVLAGTPAMPRHIYIYIHRPCTRTFHSFSVKLLSETLQPRSQRETKHCRPQ